MTGITVYTSSVSGNVMVKKHTASVTALFDAKKIPYTVVDLSLAENEALKDSMHKTDKGVTLPQVWNGKTYKGLWEEINDANEDGAVPKFLGL